MDHCEPDRGKLEVQSTAATRRDREPGFTKFDNFFLDHVMRRVSGAEWKLLCAIVRESVGWQRPDAEISLVRFMELTGLASQAVVRGLKTLCDRTAVKRRTQQAGKQRTFRYEAVPRANLKDVSREDKRRRQQAFEFVTACENHQPSPLVKITSRTPLSRCENHQPSPPVLISVKKEDLNTHTRESSSGSNAAAQSSVCVDLEIDRTRYKAYARAHPRIDDANAWATVAERTRQWDADVLEWEAQRAAWEAQRAAELERQRLELEAWQAAERRPAELSIVDSLVEPMPAVETAEHVREREAREAADRAARQRGEEMISEIRERVQRRKLGTA